MTEVGGESTKRRLILIASQASIAVLSTGFAMIGPGWGGTLAELRLEQGSRVLVHQEWRGWIDPSGYGVTLWFLPAGGDHWTYDVLSMEGRRWRGVRLVATSDGSQVQVFRGSELVGELFPRNQSTRILGPEGWERSEMLGRPGPSPANLIGPAG